MDRDEYVTFKDRYHKAEDGSSWTVEGIIESGTIN